MQAGIPVVLATRSNAGRASPRRLGRRMLVSIVSDDLMPQKARILLMLALGTTREREAIQEMFYRY